MKDEYFEILREWIRSEIEYSIYSHEEDSEGYRNTARAERDMADVLFNKFKILAKGEA